MILGSFFLGLPALALLAIVALGYPVIWQLIPDATTLTSEPSFLTNFLYLSKYDGFYSVFFPVLPWFFIALLGVASGQLYKKDPGKTFNHLGLVGAAFLLAFVAVRFFTKIGNIRPLPESPDWKVYLTLIKYPPSFLFVACTLGLNLSLLSLWQKFEIGRYGFWFFEKLGKAPFFFYMGHLVVFSALGLLFGEKGLTTGQTYAAWALAVLILYRPTLGFSRFKQRQTPDSFWRLF
jgi:uncharacterized membrane protein